MSAIANSNRPEDQPKPSRVKSYWHNSPWKKLASLVMAIALCFYLTACGGDQNTQSKTGARETATTVITEVSPPKEIQRLSRLLDRYEPQVSILSPKPDQVLGDTEVSVKFDVKDLPIFKNADFGLGPHIHVTLDNQEYKAVYDLNQTATFDHLSAGTHTIRAFASRPWHESFKNKGAYAQTTFHVLTKTGENTPATKTPLLTYSRPVGSYGAEPIMLDFYLQNAPLHLLTQDLDKAEDPNNDWKVRATIDGQSFIFDRWEPMYLQGFKQGKNWVKLELLEEDGDAIANVFNSTAHLIDFQPNGQDILSRLVSGEKIANIDAIVNPDYVPPTPEPSPTPVELVTPAPTIPPAATEPVPETTTVPSPTPKVEDPKIGCSPGIVFDAGNGFIQGADRRGFLPHGDGEQMLVVREEPGPEMLEIVAGQSPPLFRCHIEQPDLGCGRPMVAGPGPMKAVAPVNDPLSVRRIVGKMQGGVIFSQHLAPQ